MKNLKIIMLFCFVALMSAGCGSNDIKLNDTKTETVGALSLKVPTTFNKYVDEYLVSFEWDDAESAKENNCTLSVSSYNKYGTPNLEELTYENIYLETDKSKINVSTKTINGIVWHKAEYVESNKMAEIAYVTEYNDMIYTLNYSDIGSGKICADALASIEKSLEFSK